MNPGDMTHSRPDHTVLANPAAHESYEATPTAPHFVLGADIGGSHMVAAIAARDGQIVVRRAIRFSPRPDPVLNLTRLFKLLDELLTGVEIGHVAGLALGVPGTVQHKDGIVTWAPALGWTDLSLASMLTDRYALPALVENDVNLAALAEHRHGAGQGTRNMVCVLVGTNIGGGLILNGELYRGFHGVAGEIGMMIPDPMLFTEEWGDSGCLESFAGGNGIARRARLLAPSDSAIAVVAGSVNAISAEHVFQAAREHDQLAQHLVQKTIDYLSLAIANTICVLDPELIVLGGGVFASSDLVLEPIRFNVQRVVPAMPHFALARFRDDAVLVGALTLAAEAAGWPAGALQFNHDIH
ncbi:MAG: ROK family protein [Chloroflexi bacterium]|nr:MAG: ROK family protein [Chloroflexota bacterium]